MQKGAGNILRCRTGWAFQLQPDVEYPEHGWHRLPASLRSMFDWKALQVESA